MIASVLRAVLTIFVCALKVKKMKLAKKRPVPCLVRWGAPSLMKTMMPYFGYKSECPEGNVDPEWPTCCNVNLYEDGAMSVGWHSDDERLFQGKFQDIRILSLSLGVKRTFELRVNHPEERERPKRAFPLGNGDLMTMEGMTQKHYNHRVPKEEVVEGPRINLTWRWVLKHAPRCPVGRNRPPPLKPHGVYNFRPERPGEKELQGDKPEYENGKAEWKTAAPSDLPPPPSLSDMAAPAMSKSAAPAMSKSAGINAASGLGASSKASMLTPPPLPVGLVEGSVPVPPPVASSATSKSGMVPSLPTPPAPP